MTKRELFEGFGFEFMPDVMSSFHHNLRLTREVHLTFSHSDGDDHLYIGTHKMYLDTKKGKRSKGNQSFSIHFDLTKEGVTVEDIQVAGIEFIKRVHGEDITPSDWMTRSDDPWYPVEGG